jgi:hypothetical protein
MSKRKNNCEGRGRQIKIDNFGRERRPFKYYTYQDIGLAASQLNGFAMCRARTSAYFVRSAATYNLLNYSAESKH